MATRRNYNPGSARSSAEIRWLGSWEHGRGLGKGHSRLFSPLETAFAKAGAQPREGEGCSWGRMGQAVAWRWQLPTQRGHGALTPPGQPVIDPSCSVPHLPPPAPLRGHAQSLAASPGRDKADISPPGNISRHYRRWRGCHPLASLVPSYLGL